MKRTLTERDALYQLQALVKRHGSQMQAAAVLEVTQQYVCDLLKGRRGFSETMLAKLGLRRAVVSSHE